MTPLDIDKSRTIARRVRDELISARVLFQRGFLQVDPPKRFKPILQSIKDYGVMGGMASAPAIRTPDAIALIDEQGPFTYRELIDGANALAHDWSARGVRQGTGVAMLCRNHRGFWLAFYASQRLGARTVMLNTDFAGPQLKQVMEREGAQLLVCDPEFETLLQGATPPLGVITDYTPTSQDTTPPPAPAEHGTFVILTSGTTGTPKGAQRKDAPSLTPMAALLEAVPFPKGGKCLIAAPVFHSLGFICGLVAIGQGSTQILQSRFRPAAVLDALQEHRAESLVCVPIMLQRILDEQEANPRDLRHLKIVLVAGSQLGAPLAIRATRILGPVMHNLYGSTEVAFATIARPQDLAINPSTVGPPTVGTRLKIVDDAGDPLPTGTTGRIVVANAIPFEGYTGGGGKAMVAGMMSSGDLGHLDEHGLLYIDGRDDAMIVSGGENVFPDEIEVLISSHPDVAEATAVGVEDETYGQRLAVYVVRNADSSIDEQQIKDYVKDNLARFKVPRDVIFLQQLPRNPTGKVLKRELANAPLAAAPASPDAD